MLPSLLHQHVLSADISGGQEQFPVEVVNDYTRDPLPRFTYIAQNQIDPAAEAAFEAKDDEVVDYSFSLTY
ncbi:hypothetical protein AAVH_26027 [Aphelenchoides avenae]|nr:hypothetical protein AAVH_26027 [Aphelenchus avenae]